MRKKNQLPTENRVIEFSCPECKQPCRMSEVQRAVQHSDPVCNTWRAHRQTPQEFLRLAMMAAKGNLVLGQAGAAERQSQPSDQDEKLRDQVLEQIYEGIKKL
jgi:hypothetical protein